MRGSYTALAEVYDRLNAHVPYARWAKFLHDTVARFGSGKENIWADLGCGTGIITTALSAMGHEMIGIDLSPDMLMVARERAMEMGENVLWLCQDMRRFELYGTVDAITCNLDGINYLPSSEALSKCFSLVNNYLGPGGVFVFDVNTPYKFETVFGERDYCMEAEGVFCGWHNDYDRRHKTCRFDLTIFTKQEDGCWIRSEESQTEYCYSREILQTSLAKSGLEVVGIYSDFDDTPASDHDERWFFVCRGSGKE